MRVYFVLGVGKEVKDLISVKKKKKKKLDSGSKDSDNINNLSAFDSAAMHMNCSMTSLQSE